LFYRVQNDEEGDVFSDGTDAEGISFALLSDVNLRLYYSWWLLVGIAVVCIVAAINLKIDWQIQVIWAWR